MGEILFRAMHITYIINRLASYPSIYSSIHTRTNDFIHLCFYRHYDRYINIYFYLNALLITIVAVGILLVINICLHYRVSTSHSARSQTHTSSYTTDIVHFSTRTMIHTHIRPCIRIGTHSRTHSYTQTPVHTPAHSSARIPVHIPAHTPDMTHRTYTRA